MGKKLYVGNLAYNLTEDQIKEFFAQAGTVETVALITDKYSGRPKGFGFVEMATDEEAKKAIETLNGQTLSERQIVVNEARPPQKREGGFRSNNSRGPMGGGGGGYGGGGGNGGGRRDRY
jgi:cold-inducible RNA-binding protein